MSKLPRTLVVFLLFLLLAGIPAAAEEQVAKPEGETSTAQQLLELAVAAAETGNMSEAVSYANEIFWGRFPTAFRLRAALLISDLHASAGRFTSAKIWARRAYETSESDQEKGATARLYKRIAAASPLSLSASLSLTPSSNVNNGGTTDVIMIGGYPFVFGEDSPQLGGTEAEGSLSMTYRMSQTSRSLTEAFGGASFRRIWLEPRAAEVAPELSNSDFDQLGLSIGLRHNWQAFANLGPTSIALSFGTTYLAGTQTTDWRMFEARQILMQSQDRAFRLDLHLRSNDRLSSSISSSVTQRISGLYQVRLDGLEIATQFGLADVTSGSALVEKDEVAAGISVTGVGVGPISMTFAIDAAYADFPKWVLTPGGRQDVSLGARIEATYNSISVLGFNPVLTLSARQTDSNLDIFDRSQTSLGLSFRSNF